MNKGLKCFIAILLCLLSAALLTRLARKLEQGKYPLLSSLTCIETAQERDLYWNINQIELDGIFNPDGRGVLITLRNNIPNFDGYYFRIDTGEQWRRFDGGTIALQLDDGRHTIDVRASNALGGEIPPVDYAITVRDRTISLIPAEPTIVKGRYPFRFEKPDSEKMRWLKEHTLPVVASCSNQWDTFITLRRWVRGQIPNRAPVIDSQWDAKRILESVWGDPSVGFACDAYAAAYVSACVSVGLNARLMHLGDSSGKGHYATEVWSDDYAKWIYMDPLYDCHFTLQGIPLSALELHERWEEKRLEEVVQLGNEGMQCTDDYYNLFQDIQLAAANDFLSAPLASVWDLLTLKIRFIRYVDEVNPPLNRGKMAYDLVMFYYLPRAIHGLIVPVVIPVLLIVNVAVWRRSRQKP